MTSGKKASSKLRLQKIPVQAYLEPAQSKALKELSERTRVPQQVYLREGVDYVLNRYAPGVSFMLQIERRRMKPKAK